MTNGDEADAAPNGERLARLLGQLDAAIERLDASRAFAKATHLDSVLGLTRRVLIAPDGVPAIFERAPALDRAGLFLGTDWDYPERLLPAVAASAVRVGAGQAVLLECVSELRLLAVARGDFHHPRVSAEQAEHFLSQVLALNLRLVFGQSTEAERVQLGNLWPVVHRHYRFLLEGIGLDDVVGRLVDEIWRLLAQRPIQTDPIKEMITGVAVQLAGEGGAGRGRERAERLIEALYGPSPASRQDPGLDSYRDRLATRDPHALSQECAAFAVAMHETGLVSPYHPVLLRHLREHHGDLIPAALGLSGTGRDAYGCYPGLIHALIDRAVFPQTAQAIHGLSGLLERGVLYHPPVAPALWRLIRLPLAPEAERVLSPQPAGDCPPEARLLAGVLGVLGQPLGISQGNNPTCQSARALCLWACNDPDYLLEVVTRAARDHDLEMTFEGRALSSRALLASGPGRAPLLDVDPLSAVVVPHLDAIYHEMGRLCAGRSEDPHRWVNPEFHGWWVGRGFAIAVDVSSGALRDFDGFLRRFYAGYHPLYNGNNPLTHPQPVGIAATDGDARFIGWHAISIQRVALDAGGEMRVYFFNPNNDSGQDWGGGVQVATRDHGELPGESSLPFAQFASRLYLFHYKPYEQGRPDRVPAEELEPARQAAVASWARNRT